MAFSRWMTWLREWAPSHAKSDPARDLVELVSIIDHPDAFPPPSDRYNKYSDEVREKMSEITSEKEARQFVIDIYLLSLTSGDASGAGFYPPLREYVKRFNKTPELLVALFEHADVVGETSGASEWLRQAHQMDPDNVYVLWKRILSRGDSW